MQDLFTLKVQKILLSKGKRNGDINIDGSV